MLRWLIALLILGVMAEFGFGFVQSHRATFGACGDAPFGDLALRASSGGPRTLKVLFVGNSLTETNDLPGALVRVANSDPQNPVRLVVGSNTRGGASLQVLYNDGCALRRIRAEHFDAVVLQEHSYFWTTPEEAAEARNGLAAWASAVRQTGAAPVYFEPWLFGVGAVPAGAAVRDLRVATDADAEVYGAPVVRVGEAFAETSSTAGAPDLYEADRHHPSAAGAYFAALIFFHHFTGEPAERAAWRPDGVSADQAAVLARTADAY